MKYFNGVIEQLVQMHKDPNTRYAPTKMFASSNELSFAISRLMDAQKILEDETFERKEIAPDLQEQWLAVRERMTQETAQNIAICIINNTPLSKTDEEIAAIEKLFYNTLYDFTADKALSSALTNIFFSSEINQTATNFQFKGK